MMKGCIIPITIVRYIQKVAKYESCDFIASSKKTKNDFDLFHYILKYSVNDVMSST